MIQKVEMHQAVCDGCGDIFGYYDANNVKRDFVFKSEQSARKTSKEWEWLEIDGKLYCPDCVEYDHETDSYKPKKKEK